MSSGVSAPIMENHETLMKDSAADGEAKVIAKGDIITTVTTEKKAEEEKAEEGDTKKDTAETPEPAATSPLRQDTKVSCCPHLDFKDFRDIGCFLFDSERCYTWKTKIVS